MAAKCRSLQLPDHQVNVSDMPEAANCSDATFAAVNQIKVEFLLLSRSGHSGTVEIDQGKCSQLTLQWHSELLFDLE